MFDVPDPLVFHVLLITHELCMIIFASLIIGILSVTDVFMCPKHTDNILFKLFIAWQCSLVASWCTLCVGTPKFSRGVMLY